MTRGTSDHRRGLLVSAMVLSLGACGPSAAIDRTSVVSPIGESDGGTTGGSGGTTANGGAGGTIANEGRGGSGTGGDLGTGGASGMGGASGTSGDPGTGGSPATGGASGGSSGGATGGSSGGGSDAGVDTGALDTKPAAPTLMVSYTLAGATSNLTNTGKLDWVHWGYTTATSVNKKKNSPGLITLKKIGTPDFGHYDSRPATLSWSDGNPKTSVTEISDGIEMASKTAIGFELRVTGNKNKPRTLLLYIGGWQAKAKFTAQVGSSTETAYSNDAFRATDPGVDRIYTVTFQPTSDADQLVVRWTMEEILATYGNVTLQAAALSE